MKYRECPRNCNSSSTQRLVWDDTKKQRQCKHWGVFRSVRCGKRSTGSWVWTACDRSLPMRRRWAPSVRSQRTQREGSQQNKTASSSNGRKRNSARRSSCTQRCRELCQSWQQQNFLHLPKLFHSSVFSDEKMIEKKKKKKIDHQVFPWLAVKSDKSPSSFTTTEKSGMCPRIIRQLHIFMQIQTQKTDQHFQSLFLIKINSVEL